MCKKTITRKTCVGFGKNDTISRFAARAIFSLAIVLFPWQFWKSKTVGIVLLAALLVVLGLLSVRLWRDLRRLEGEDLFIVRRKLERVSSRLSLHRNSIGMRYTFHFEKGWEYAVREPWGVIELNRWPEDSGSITAHQLDREMLAARGSEEYFYLLIWKGRVIAGFPQGSYELETGDYYEVDGRLFLRKKCDPEGRD